MENTYELMHYMSGAGASIACCGVVHVDQWYDYEPTSEELSCTDTNTILGTIWLQVRVWRMGMGTGTGTGTEI